MKMINSLNSSPVLVVCGTGGVGKTTSSCAIAIAVAQEFDLKVLVLTIDPAKRLADVLTQQDLSHKPTKINIEKFIDGKCSGEVYAAMVDTKTGWDEIVNRYSKSEKDASRIFENKLYNNLTTRFSHSHDFVAMDQLYEHYRSGNYDFIVLDTPPSSQAFGFFDAPSAMADFFGGRLVRLVTSPYRIGNGKAAKLFDLASQPFFMLADKVLGKQFINDIGEFFFLFHTMYDDFVERSKSITAFLTSDKVHASLILNGDQIISKSYESMAKGLEKRNISLTNIIVNNIAFKHDDIQIKNYLDSTPEKEQDKIFELIKRDYKTSLDVYEEMLALTSSVQVRENIGYLGRITETNEVKRLKLLVESVQKLAQIDDTIK
ncbi:MAG: ArsA-related P-loop ATPase [Acidimicrobiia bacterium]